MINKDRNVNLQLTITKGASEKLNKIQNQLSDTLNLNLSKSQTIEFLIKKFNDETLFDMLTSNQEKESKEKAKTETSAQILALKDSLNVSYPKLAELIGISQTNIKRYAYGEQEPTGENKILILKALKKYGIK